MLLPVLGFFNTYFFRYSFVCDHFQYLASLGPLVIATAGISILLRPFVKGKPLLEPAVCVLLLLTLGTLSWKQCRTYKDTETLWQTSLRINPDSSMAHNNLGFELLYKDGRVDEAMAEFQSALKINPRNAEALANIGRVFSRIGRMDEAIVQYQKALEFKPNFPEAHSDLGNCFFAIGRIDDAISQYKKAFEFKPDYAQACFNLGNALGQLGHLDQAATQFQKAIEFKPDYADAYLNLGAIYSHIGRMDDAISQYKKAVEIKPDNAEALHNLGNALLHQGRMAEAITQYQLSLKIKPDDADSRKNLAWLLATCPQAALRNGNKAVELAEQANLAAKGQDPLVLTVSAAAYAENGTSRRSGGYGAARIAVGQHTIQPWTGRTIAGTIESLSGGNAIPSPRAAV